MAVFVRLNTLVPVFVLSKLMPAEVLPTPTQIASAGWQQRGAIWRNSLQVRVGATTVIVTSAVVLIIGIFLVNEINVELPPGQLMGELGFLTPDNRRTATIECIEDGHALTITYEKLLEIYFQNPQFGYYFLVLTSQRLLDNLARAEATIAQYKTAAAAQTTGAR